MASVDAESEPDFFWALRGSGGSFGLVTAIEFNLNLMEATAAAKTRHRFGGS
jgi:hypothetical protein